MITRVVIDQRKTAVFVNLTKTKIKCLLKSVGFEEQTRKV